MIGSITGCPRTAQAAPRSGKTMKLIASPATETKPTRGRHELKKVGEVCASVTSLAISVYHGRYSSSLLCVEHLRR